MYARAVTTKGEVDGETLPFTNVTDMFLGMLDYIFYESSRWTLTKRLHVPTSLKERNHAGRPKGHLIPSVYWPSDHLAVGGTLRLLGGTSTSSSTTTTTPPVSVSGCTCTATTMNSSTPSTLLPFPETQKHRDTCDYGCVPPIYIVHV